MTRCLAFTPERIAAAAPVMRPAGLVGQAKCVVVHICEHQDIAGYGVLNDHGGQTIGVVPNVPWRQIVHERESRTGMPRPARCFRASAMRYSPKWKIEAASTASARPGARPSHR